ncbi:MAG: ATP-binding cassette domain-containing protein [bacterium]|nr:ATP-binding cassette domain-containing protein [bacterium]
MLKFDKVNFTYPDKTTALKNVSFEIEPGEFVYLIGHTGAGKTTLLRLILADLKPTKGRIFFEDKDIAQLKEWERQLLRQKIGVVFQGLNLLPELTIKENLFLRLELAGVDKKEYDSRIKKVLNRFNMSDKTNYFPSQLSGGEKQRIAMARALILDPLLIFADEPTGNLDPASSLDIIDELEKINKEGIMVIVSTHDKEIVNQKKHRVLTLNKGQLISDKRKGGYVSH